MKNSEIQLLKKIADLCYQASEEVWDDNNDNGSAGILRLCDTLTEKIDAFIKKEERNNGRV